jgi:hypothetical protein
LKARLFITTWTGPEPPEAGAAAELEALVLVDEALLGLLELLEDDEPQPARAITARGRTSAVRVMAAA